MKSQDEINDEAIGYASHNDPKGNVNPEGYSEKQVGLLHGFIDGYQKCQEDLNNFIGFIKTPEELEVIMTKHLEADVYGEPLSELNLNECGEIELQGIKSGFINGYRLCETNSSSEINKYKLAIEVQENTIKNFKRKIIENSGRDNDVLKLSEAVLNASPSCWDNPNGAYETTCPFCDVTEHRGGGKGSVWASMSELEHKSDCAYLIAKDLSTGLL